MESEDLFEGYGVEITLKERDDFLKVKETLTRLGVSSRRENKLYQSCHILHKRGKYAILHFKELFSLDGLDSDISDTDIGRRNTIVKLLEQWKLISIVDESMVSEPIAPLSQIKIIPHKEKNEWKLTTKYSIGNTKNT